MGGAQSKNDFYCDTHVTKNALAFCFTHKMFICMTCVATKEHIAIDCRIQEIEDMRHGMKECFIMKQEIIKANKKLSGEKIEVKMKQEIEDAYTKALENLEKLKSTSHQVTMKDIEEIKAREEVKINHLCQQLDRAIECFDAGKTTEAENFKREAMRETFCCDLNFEKVKPAPGEQDKFLVKIKEINTSCWEKQMEAEEKGLGRYGSNYKSTKENTPKRPGLFSKMT